MNVAVAVFDDAVDAGLVLSRHGERVHVESPLGHPLPEALKARIVDCRTELLAWLEWRETADDELLACSRRLAESYPPGCPLEGEGWRAAEEQLMAAYRSQEPGLWRETLSHYESFALERFRAYRLERK